MKRLLVFQHVPHEILGTFNPLLKYAGFRIRYVNFGRTPDATPNVEKYDGLIILGGPMCVDQIESHPHLQTEIDAIKLAMEQHMPVLGICLGAQLIATALGAQVKRNPVKEIGWYDVTPTTEGNKDHWVASRGAKTSARESPSDPSAINAVPGAQRPRMVMSLAAPHE